MKERFSDAELDAIRDEIHIHSYVETMDSKEPRSINGAYGQYRTFKCVGCGLVRHILIRGSKEEI